MFFGKEIKRKVAIRMHYSQAEIDVPPKKTLIDLLNSHKVLKSLWNIFNFRILF